MVKFTKRITSVVISVLLLFTLSFSTSASENYKSWVQYDSRWSNKTLGSCSETMSQIGCAVTSIAILAVHSQSASESTFNPGILCDYLSKNDGFDSYGNLYWGTISGLVPDFTFKKRAAITNRSKAGIVKQLSEYINEGYYIVLSVEYDGHWVAIDTVKDGEVYMMDPAQNSTNKLFDYYDTDGMLQVRLYQGKVAPGKVDTSPYEKTYLTGHYTIASSLNLRSSYSTSSDILTTIPKGNIVVVTRVYNNEWGEVTYSGKTGWIYLEYTDYIESSYKYNTGVYKVNEKDGVYLRRGIGTQSTIECLVPYNAQLKIDLITANWGRASYGSNSGWVCMEYVKYQGASETVTTTAVTTAAKTSTTTKTTTTKVVTTTKVTTTELPLIKGDVNRDGKFTKTDLILLNKYIANPVSAKFEERYVMDVNSDKVIDERDSVYLLKIINKGN